MEKEKKNHCSDNLLFGKDAVALNQAMLPIVKFSFLESVGRNVEDLIILNDMRERSFGTNEKKIQE